MNKIKRSAIVPYSHKQMYTLVTDINAYPDFLPWCSKSEILHRDESITVARLTIAFKGINQSFTTRNTSSGCEAVTIELVDGPFNHLRGDWVFTPLSQVASKIELNLEFTFSSKWLEKLLGPVFGMIGNSMVDSFQARAKQLYG